MSISRRDGQRFTPPDSYEQSFYRELKPISADYQAETLRVNGLDRDRLLKEGESPESAMADAYRCSAGVAACSARTPKCPFIPQTTDQEIRRIPIQNRCDRARTRVAIHGQATTRGVRQVSVSVRRFGIQRHGHDWKEEPALSSSFGGIGPTRTPETT